MKTNQQIIATINNKVVSVIDDFGQELVPIKPICDILGIDARAQREKVKTDEILNSVGVLSTSVGADGKDREMFCLPIQYVFGWLFTINPANVKPEAREAVTNYRRECYDALYRHFDTGRRYLAQYREFMQYKEEELNAHLDHVRQLRSGFNSMRVEIKAAEAALDEVRRMTMDDYAELPEDTEQLTLNLEIE